MRKELDEALCEKYPDIFKDRHGDMRETAMCWGFDCGDGWYNIIDNLCATIKNREYNLKLNKKEFVPVVATQVKEKFGSLRFYYNGGDDYVDGAASLAEYLSERTCEKCGAPGKMRGHGWYYTACDEHTREEDKENE
jgi:hypothetical protein